MMISSQIDCRESQAADKRTRGFALLITIVLVAFLVLILVGLATFARVETVVADNSQSVSAARQNALTALNIAVGKLQRYAGPDQSVTARSESVGNLGVLNNPYITGVWDTTAGVLGNVPTAWLVSGTEGAALPNATAGILDASIGNLPPVSDDISVPANNWVFLVYDNSAGDSTLASSTPAERARRIRLLKQPLQAATNSLPGFPAAAAGNTTIGHYAYWVGDEGVKASVSIIEPDLTGLNYNNTGIGGDNWTGVTGADRRERLSQFGLLRPRVDQVVNAINYTNAQTQTDLTRISTLDQLRFVTGWPDKATWQASFHQFTPLSLGVIAQTDAGTGATTNRLRTDFSASVIAPVAGSTAINDYWVERPSAETVLQATYDIAAPNTSGSNIYFSVAPSLSEAGVFLNFTTDVSGNLILQTEILAEFWNSYAASIRTTATDTLTIQVSTTANIVIQATDSSATVHTITIPSGNIAVATVSAGEVLPPGAIVQFRSDSTNALSSTSSGAANTTFSSGAAAMLPVTTFSLPAIPADSIMIDVLTGAGQVLQTFKLQARSAETVVPSGSTYEFGYGFELVRDLSRWTDPSNAAAKDPRTADIGSADCEPLATSNWNANASTAKNPNVFAGGLPFIPSNLILFDLPRQEITSLAQLRHMVGTKPYEFGSAGAADNPLWDTAFVSTVPRYFAWDYTANPRPNRYLEVYSPLQAPAAEWGNAAARLASLRSVDSARYQLIRGAFNINSTSVEAWKAVLGSNVSNWRSQSAGTVNLTNAFFRASHGAQEGASADMVTSATVSDATTVTAVGRQLTNADINNLATAIVTQIINQPGPFKSLAAFVDSNVLSTAITNSGVNGTLTAPYRYTAGAITPGDVLASIAPFMAARSDTFKVRTYGDVINPMTGEVEARAWCEAVLQRTPDLLANPADVVANVVKADPAANPFGRKFQIVSFRWLNQSDL